MKKETLIKEIAKVSKLPKETLEKMSIDVLKDVLKFQTQQFETMQKLKTGGRPVHQFSHELPAGEMVEFENIKATIKDSIMYVAISLEDKHRTLTKTGEPVFSKSSGTASLCATWKYLKVSGFNLKVTVTRPSTKAEREKYGLDAKVAAYKAAHPKK